MGMTITEELQKTTQPKQPTSLNNQLNRIEETLKGLTEQTPIDLTPIQQLLSEISGQQQVIIDLLKSKIDLDTEERELIDLAKKLIATG